MRRVGAAQRGAAAGPGGAIVVSGAVDSSPLLAGRGRVNGRDAAYVCRGRVCDLPVTSAADLEAALNHPPRSKTRRPRTTSRCSGR